MRRKIAGAVEPSLRCLVAGEAPKDCLTIFHIIDDISCHMVR
jgi:hypothetical protein